MILGLFLPSRRGYGISDPTKPNFAHSQEIQTEIPKFLSKPSASERHLQTIKANHLPSLLSTYLTFSTPAMKLFLSGVSVALFWTAIRPCNAYPTSEIESLKAYFSENRANARTPATPYDGVFRPDIPSYVGVSDIPQQLIEEADQHLEAFIDHLKSFVHHTEFESGLFEAQRNRSATELHQITVLVERVAPFRRPLTGRLRFATHMFRTMEKASDDMRDYGLSGTDNLLVRCIIQLNVALLALPVKPNASQLEIATYRQNLTQFRRVLNSWSALFATLSGVPLKSREKFEHELSGAEVYVAGIGGAHKGSKRGGLDFFFFC
ncbi:hypothetical protein JCM33374_g3810 [Metschnikowia sp. JCM 33374]|nr:hypothetical protein JCM33374_g3810 [Metschnikowia sp. JCM 33374]